MSEHKYGASHAAKHQHGVQRTAHAQPEQAPEAAAVEAAPAPKAKRERKPKAKKEESAS